MATGITRRFLTLLIIVGGFLLIFFYGRGSAPLTSAVSSGTTKLRSTKQDAVEPGLLTGHAIAPKLGNETAKKELGNAAWRVLHTTFARFPDKPTTEESKALDSYIHLFQRLYPCGECAEHFGKLLEKFPPQTTSRSAAAAWGCHVHNEVNKRLKKELFDCSKIGDFYDCGCADGDDDRPKKKQDGSAGKTDDEDKAKLSDSRESQSTVSKKRTRESKDASVHSGMEG